jgi:hypothetical protein
MDLRRLAENLNFDGSVLYFDKEFNGNLMHGLSLDSSPIRKPGFRGFLAHFFARGLLRLPSFFVNRQNKQAIEI